MARNGSGTYERVHDWTTDRDANVKVQASRMDEEFDDIATALTGSVAKDGQTTMTGALPMGSQKITGLATGTATTDAATVAQAQTGTNAYAVDSGAADAYVITPSPAITAYAAGQMFRFKATNTNTGASTINVNAVGAQAIKKGGTNALTAGDIVSGVIYTIVYDGTNFQLGDSLDNKAINMQDKVLQRAKIQDISGTVNALGNITGTLSTGAIDYESGHLVTGTLTGNITIANDSISNWPASGTNGWLELVLTQDGTGSRTITFGSAFKAAGGSVVLSTTAAARDRIFLSTTDGGTTIDVDINKNYTTIT